MINCISNTVALVTGGASGLGLATVSRLLEKGAKGVVSLDLRNPDIIHSNLVSIIGNVCKDEDVEEALKQCEQKFGHLNVVVNCAGVLLLMRVYDDKTGEVHRLDDFKRVLDVNVVGTFNVVRLATKQMVKNEMQPNGQKGVIVMTSSVASFDAQGDLAAYGASKGAINGMTLAIARDLASSGIRCVSMAPGLFKTSILDVWSEKIQNSLVETVPCPKRLGDPVEFAHMVQTIIENSMLNGEIIRLDAAIRIQP